MNQIPSVDLKDFLCEDLEKKSNFVKSIGEAFQKIGFCAVKGHFLDDELVDKLYKQIKLFFDLPTDIKRKYEYPEYSGQRGYVSYGKESAKGSKHGDLKEFWHFGQYLDDDEYVKFNYPKNQTVTELPRFNNIGKKVFQSLEKTAIYVLRAISLYLDLEEDHFDKYVKKGNSILRPIHYPPIQTKPKGAERAAAHGDINLITLLMGAQGRGLQVLTNDGEWIDAIAKDDEIVINVGDMLSRYTNNKLKSTIHKVINPPKELWKKSRYSIPFFLHPIGTMSLNVLDSCIDENNPKKYEDITAHEFLIQRLRDIGVL